MRCAFSLAVMFLAVSGAVFGQATDTPFQVAYAAHLDVGDAVLTFTNTGASSTVAIPQNGNLCVNLYAFDPAEELISCCSCLVTPNGLKAISVNQDIASNLLTPGTPTSIVIKAMASVPVANSCNPSTVGTGANVLATGMIGWATSLAPGVGNSFFPSRNQFAPATLSAAELAHITSFCNFIQVNGSSYGICKSCRAGGLGAASK